jgi:aryl-alcohol dehydrogenase-like predicted oxidoreductase
MKLTPPDIKNNRFDRRRFLRGSTAALAGLSLRRAGLDLERLAAAPASDSKIRSYRALGRTGFKVSDIAFGSSGLTDPSVLQAALDSGINYLDCAEVYLGGQVERTVGRVLKHRNRKAVFLTTKVVIRTDESKASVKDRAAKCLSRLGTDYIDCFMMHATATTALVKHPGFHAAVEELKAEGRVRFCGISSHGSHYGDLPETMDQVLLAAAEDGRFDVMLFVYNFIQRDMGRRVLRACRDKNIGAVLMKANPVANYFEVQDEINELQKQGRKPHPSLTALAARLKAVADQAGAFPKSLKVSDGSEVRKAALKFVLSDPDMSSACVTISSHADLKAFVALSGQRLSKAEMGLLGAYEMRLGPLYCRHACGLCEGGCPYGVPVNTIMRYSHYLRAQARRDHASAEYAALPGPRAERCLDCPGHCQEVCPYGVPVQGLLALAHQALTLG